MIRRLKWFWTIAKRILMDNSGQGDIETVKKILLTPVGYKFLEKNREKYAVQLGMLNHLLEQKLITAREHAVIKGNMKRKYNIE